MERKRRKEAPPAPAFWTAGWEHPHLSGPEEGAGGTPPPPRAWKAKADQESWQDHSHGQGHEVAQACNRVTQQGFQEVPEVEEGSLSHSVTAKEFPDIKRLTGENSSVRRRDSQAACSSAGVCRRLGVEIRTPYPSTGTPVRGEGGVPSPAGRA